MGTGGEYGDEPEVTVGSRAGKAEHAVGESKDKLEPVRTKWTPSVITISSSKDVGDLQRLASFVMELHMHVAQNLKKLREIRPLLKNLSAQLLSGAKKVSQPVSGNAHTLQYCPASYTDLKRIITTESLVAN